MLGLRHLVERLERKVDNMSAELDKLNTAVALAVKTMQDAATVIQSNSSTPAALNSAADNLNAAANSLAAVITPPATDGTTTTAG